MNNVEVSLPMWGMGTDPNSIEGSWLHAKKVFPKFGTSKSLAPSYLMEFLWRWSIKRRQEDPFEAFLRAVTRVYKPESVVGLPSES